MRRILNVVLCCCLSTRSTILIIIRSLIIDVYVFVPCCLFMTFYDVPIMIHLAMVHVLSKRRIIAWHNRYRSFFCMALGKEWSTTVTIVRQVAWCFIVLIWLVKFLGCIIRLYGATRLLVWFIDPLRSFWMYGRKNTFFRSRQNQCVNTETIIWVRVGDLRNRQWFILSWYIFRRHWGLKVVSLLSYLPIVVTPSIVVEILPKFPLTLLKLVFNVHIY